MSATPALVLVGTPIGNLGDMSSRAVEALRSADVIASEDTRVTRKLLSYFDIKGKELVSVPAHHEQAGADKIIQALQAGKSVAFTSDAGMPGVADPGSLVVQKVREQGFGITTVPGPTALATALSLSGMQGDRFVFEGFLPAKGAERTRRLQLMTGEERTIIVYESPHRVVRTLTDMKQLFSDDRTVVLARELTKKFEEIIGGSISEIVAYFTTREPRGEYVIVIEGAQAAEVSDEEIIEELKRVFNESVSVKTAVDRVSKELGASKNHVYELALKLKSTDL